jgi:hypothetical protein
MRNIIEYQREYRAKNKERLNKLSKECMQRKREKDKQERIDNQRKHPKPPQYIKKTM